jgi:hypothetical protein
MPGNGEMIIFNRSHYEDVLAAGVHELVAPEVWKARYEQINAFDKIPVEGRHDHPRILPAFQPRRTEQAFAPTPEG